MSKVTTRKRASRNSTTPKWGSGSLADHLSRSRKGAKGASSSSIDEDGDVKARVGTKDIEAWLAELLGVTPDLAQDIWRVLTARFREQLLVGEPVVLSRIGTIEPYQKKSTTYRHPSTGELTDIPAKNHLRLTVSQSYRQDANTKSKRKSRSKAKPKSKVKPKVKARPKVKVRPKVKRWVKKKAG